MEQVDSEGSTALFHAAESNQLEFAEWCLGKMCD